MGVRERERERPFEREGRPRERKNQKKRVKEPIGDNTRCLSEFSQQLKIKKKKKIVEKIMQAKGVRVDGWVV